MRSTASLAKPQSRKGTVLSLALSALCAAAALSNGIAVRAQEPVKITVTAQQAWLRNAPSLTAGNTVPVTKGQFYDVIARTPDNTWWQLAVPGASGANGTWLLSDLGAPYSGDLKAAPVAGQPAALAAKPVKASKKKPAPLPSWIPAITPRQRAIWQNSVQAGKDLNTFTVVGDCNSQPPVYLQRLASGQFDASTLDARLQAIVQRFSPSFGRISLAAQGGFGAGAMMDPTWADGALCDKTMGPFACELWVSRASVVFISLGTQEQYEWKDFEQNYRPMIEHALQKGVLPVLVTKADDIETASDAPSSYINDIVRRLAKEYDVPLFDFWAATRDLPNGGLIDEGDKDFHQSYAGMDRRILGTLQTLAAITGQ
jgi:hypothetical protein